MSRRLLPAATALLLVVTAVAAAPATRTRAATDMLPDLRMQPLTSVTIRVENGRRLLRFTAIMSNLGVGHFEVHAHRSATSDPWTVSQVIFDDMGGSREQTTDTTLVYAGDGHDHWHVKDMMFYDLWGPGGTYREEKIGFCFLDTTPIALSLPGARQASYYRESACEENLDYRTGISIGWGDNYPWYFAYQWVDITGIAPGVYTLRSIVDPLNHFSETNDANNCAWVRVSIPASGNGTVLGSGSTCIDDIEGTPFAGDINWLYDQELTAGCRVMLFCTDDPVSRGQMAAFLNRAQSLPPSATDYFTDDDTSIFQNDINRLADAGITGGCAPNLYCPAGFVTRGQMAAFLVRALHLPPTVTDYFTDDDTSIFEGDINRLAAAGITGGCGPDSFCPSGLVTRGQMAAFLHRAFG
jgi:Lysyl oxidase/S-layer homology domain